MEMQSVLGWNTRNICCFLFSFSLEARSHQSLKNNMTTFWIDCTVTWLPLAFKASSRAVRNWAVRVTNSRVIESSYMFSALQQTEATTLKITPFNFQSHLSETDWHFSQFILQPYAVCELITLLLQKVSRSSFHGALMALGLIAGNTNVCLQTLSCRGGGGGEDEILTGALRRFVCWKSENTDSQNIWKRLQKDEASPGFKIPVPPDRSLFTVNTKKWSEPGSGPGRSRLRWRTCDGAERTQPTDNSFNWSESVYVHETNDWKPWVTRGADGLQPPECDVTVIQYNNHGL